jgi:hypothetical protein
MSFMNIVSAHLGAQFKHQTRSASAASTISRYLFAASFKKAWSGSSGPM